MGFFAQLKHRFNAEWAAEVGIRYEDSFAQVDDFIPLTQVNQANPYLVKGRKVTSDAWLYNANLSFSPVDAHVFYGSFSQGFQLPDVGLVLRNADTGFDLGSSFLAPVKVDHYELGWKGNFNQLRSNLAVFYSRSDLGAVQSFNGGLNLARTQENISGIEATVDYLDDQAIWGGGGSATWMQGRETLENSSDNQKMTGYRIPPLKLSAYITFNPSDVWLHRIQATYFAAEDYRLAGQESFGRYAVKGYTTVDLMSHYHLDDQNTISMGLENLLNRQYYPLYSQLLRSNTNTSHLTASGMTLKVSYSHMW